MAVKRGAGGLRKMWKDRRIAMSGSVGSSSLGVKFCWRHLHSET